jgi:phage gp29-like protein
MVNTNNLQGVEKVRPVYITEVGSTGLERYGGTIYEEFLPQLTMPNCLKIYKEMSNNDPIIGAVLFIYEQMIRKCSWEVRPASEKEQDKKAADFVKECMDDMSHTWVDFITEVLSMFPYGWAWHELCYKYRRGELRDRDLTSKYGDNKIGWAKIPIRSQSSWNNWVFDNNIVDRVIGMEQNAPNINKVIIIPWEKSLHFKTKPARGNPEGVSLLRNAYRPWFFKKHIEEIEGIGIERDLAGLPVMTTPEGVDIYDTNNPEAVTLKATLEKIISNIRRDKNEGVLKPYGYDLELLSTGSKRQFDTNAIINRYDQRIAVTLLSDIILLGTDKTGSFALADVKKSLLAAALEAQLSNIASVINKYAIPRLLKLNAFNIDKFPEIVPGEIESPDMVKLADAMSRFTQMGMRFFPHQELEEKVWSDFGFPKGAGIPKAKDLDLEREKFNNNNNNNNLPPRKYEEHQTDDKEQFNDMYQREGRKD